MVLRQSVSVVWAVSAPIGGGDSQTLLTVIVESINGNSVHTSKSKQDTWFLCIVCP